MAQLVVKMLKRRESLRQEAYTTLVSPPHTYIHICHTNICHMSSYICHTMYDTNDYDCENGDDDHSNVMATFTFKQEHHLIML